MPRGLPRSIRVPPVAHKLFEAFTKQLSEVFTNAVAGAVDDGLERVETKVQEGLGRIRRARGVAQRRTRRGRKPS